MLTFGMGIGLLLWWIGFGVWLYLFQVLQYMHADCMIQTVLTGIFVGCFCQLLVGLSCSFIFACQAIQRKTVLVFHVLKNSEHKTTQTGGFFILMRLNGF